MEIQGYKITEKLYEGYNSIVYKGTKGSGNYLLKYLKFEYPTPAQIQGFQKESDILKFFDSNLVPKLVQVIQHNNSYVIVIEDVNGVSLDKEVLSLTVGQFLDISIKTVNALDFIHKQNIVHRDLKPHNVIYNKNKGLLQIIDFGSATRLTRENPVLLNSGNLEGTLAYISPEQTGRMNRNIDYRTDYYSLGITLYHLLTGKLPFQTSDSMELIHSHIARYPKTPHELNSNVPKQLSEIIMKLIQKNPEDR